VLCNADMALKMMGPTTRRKDHDFEVNDKRLGIRHLGMRYIEEKLTKDFCLSIACINLDSLNWEEMCKRIMDR
jgi:hypothetical protein